LTESTAPPADKGKLCPLCSLPQNEVLAELGRWRLARTKTMKGHRERLMLLYREHAKTIDEQSIGEAYLTLHKVGQKFFSHAKQWAIFEPIYATVPEHWHRVASDLDAKADDHDQILKTPRLIVDNEDGTITRVTVG